jgi:hypothetical protein
LTALPNFRLALSSGGVQFVIGETDRFDSNAPFIDATWHTFRNELLVGQHLMGDRVGLVGLRFSYT